MKKRIFAILLIAAMALSMAACGGKKEETETAAETEAAAEAEAAESAEETEAGSGEELEGAVGGMVTEDGEYIEEVFVEGTVSSIDGSVLSINTIDGTTMSFDTANASIDELDKANLVEGAYVETSYLDAPDAAEPYDASYVTVLMNLEEQADSMGVNPTLYGTVTFVDINDLTIRDANGTEVSFDNSISREVTFGGIKAGTEVRVTYMGSIYPENQVSDDEGTGSGAPVAIKIVSEDAANSEEAAADYITGPASDVSEGSITVDTSYDSFTFTADPSMLSGIEESMNVRVYYEGVLAAGRSIPATQVTAG